MKCYRGVGVCNAMFFFLLCVVPTSAFGIDNEKAKGKESTASYQTKLKVPSRSSESKGMNFASINRLQYKHSFNGESAFIQGAFIILPHGITVAELYQTFTEKGNKGDMDEFENFNLEIKLARYLIPSNKWGRLISLVGRFQAVNEMASVYSVGLQWNISETPMLKRGNSSGSWKSILQIFVKEKTDYSAEKAGTVDLFHWYQFPLIGDKLYFRGANTYYYLPGQKNSYYLMQDLIWSLIPKRLDIFLRHEFQNVDFLGHGKGSQTALGFRVAH